MLEIAVVLGTEVPRREWELSCEYAGVTLTDELVDGLVATYLIREDVNSAGESRIRCSPTLWSVLLVSPHVGAFITRVAHEQFELVIHLV